MTTMLAVLCNAAGVQGGTIHQYHNRRVIDAKGNKGTIIGAYVSGVEIDWDNGMQGSFTPEQFDANEIKVLPGYSSY